MRSWQLSLATLAKAPGRFCTTLAYTKRYLLLSLPRKSHNLRSTQGQSAEAGETARQVTGELQTKTTFWRSEALEAAQSQRVNENIQN